MTRSGRGCGAVGIALYQIQAPLAQIAERADMRLAWFNMARHRLTIIATVPERGKTFRP